jgi:hypothetical protein
MSRRLRGAGLALALAATACGREKTAGQRPLPPGDAVWFSAGLVAGEPEAEEVLARGAFAHVFLPAVRLARQGDVWRTVLAPPPPRPLARSPVVLVVEAGTDFEAALSPGAEEGLAISIAEGLRELLGRRAAFGRVEGTHLDLPFSGATAEVFGALVAKLRSRLPGDLFLTCSLRFTPAEKERENFEKRLSAVDGFVAFVFGEGARADPIAADALGKPWWAGYLPGARGQWRDVSGDPRGALTEKFLARLTDDARAPLGYDLALRQEGVSGFVFRPTAPLEIDGARFAAGDQIAFEQPAVTELLYRFGSDLVGRRLVRGRLVVLEGASESERIFTLSALSDVLLGRPLLPELEVSVEAEPSGVRIAAENRSVHASVVSRTTNWVEVDVPSNHIGDVRLGDFDRYEVFDAEGRPVTPGRATRVRFYETLVSPGERIGGAAILVRGRPPADCCRFRSHVLAASGPELAGDWTTPPAPPTPTPVPAPKAKAKRGRR